MLERIKRLWRSERGAITVKNLPAWAIAAIRTATQSVIGLVLSQVWVIDLLAWMDQFVGISLTQSQVENTAFVLATAAVVAFVNWLDRFPQIGKFVNTLISLFTSTSGVLGYQTPQDLGDSRA